MKLEITAGGETHTVDFDPRQISLQEAVRLEEQIGPERTERLLDGDMRVMASPTAIRALVWAKLSTVHPDVDVDGFDLDLGALADSLAESDDAVPLPTAAETEAALFTQGVDPAEVVEGKASAGG